MAYSIDTNVLARLANLTDAQHAVAAHAVVELHRRGAVLHVTPQVLIEFPSVATRPKSQNGLGLCAADAEAPTAGFEASFPLLIDRPDVYSARKAMVAALAVIGKQVHDARLVAVCHVHTITHLLTLNMSDFTGMTGYGPGLVIVDPASI